MESDSFSDSQSNSTHRRRRPSKTFEKRPQFILNTRIKSSGDKSTGRTNDSEEGIVSPSLNLTLYGSPAPRCLQRPSAVKPKKIVQPPNTPIDSAKIPSKPLQLPIENILLLNERLELSKKEKIKVELSARQIKISDDESERYFKFQEEANDILSSSTIDLSIDLSSVTNSDHETETSSDDMDCSESMYRCVPHKCEERCESTSTLSQSPMPYVWNGSDHKICSARSNESMETSYPWTRTTGRRSTGSSSILFTDSNESGDALQSQLSNTTPKQRSRSADLIYVYVNTVNNHNKLSKYFRTCQKCNEACCICPDLVPDTNRTFFLKESEEKVSEEKNSRPGSRCSEFSNFLYERCYLKKDLSNDSGTSTLQLDSDTFRSGEKSVMDKLMSSKKQVSLSMMQLATAAQCARILANSLESVLEMTVDQSVSPRESIKNENLVQFKDADLNDLFKSLDILKNSFQPKNAEDKDEAKWINFDKMEKESSKDFGFEDNFDENFLKSNFF